MVTQKSIDVMKRPKYKILSPDGFTIEFNILHYRSMKKADEAFNQFKERYKSQGYYSSTNFGRIPLDELENYCTFVTV
jgi:hypothetical protein